MQGGEAIGKGARGDMLVHAVGGKLRLGPPPPPAPPPRDSLEGKDSASLTTFRSNGCSRVHFVPPIRATRRARPAAELQPPPAAPPVSAAAAAGSSAAAKAPAPPAPAPAAAAPAAKVLALPSSASGAAAPPPPAAKKEKAAPSAKGGNTLAGMWGKVPQAAAKKAEGSGGGSQSGGKATPAPATAAAVAVAPEPEEVDLEDAGSPLVAAKRSKRKVRLSMSYFSHTMF